MLQSDSPRVELINLSLIHLGLSVLEDSHLGIVTVPKDHWSKLCLPSFRQYVICQLSDILPDNFLFCSKERHTILGTQENEILATQIVDHSNTILIRSNQDLPQLIIKDRSTQLNIGHVQTTFKSSLADIRFTITNSCFEVNKTKETFEFLFSDGSAVPAHSEEVTQAHECLRGHEIQIQFIDEIPEESNYRVVPMKRKSHMSLERARSKELRRSFSSSKDVDRHSNDESVTITQNTDNSKQLLISYVRAEAAEHALKLKKKLTSFGFSVYLDVHEIKSGIDWQDSLNYAVSNCEVFIPLVTPRYGETQWTNREVKLADVLGKPILPISFLAEWPPRCLAIQFATTQYIRWKSPEQIHNEVTAGKKEALDNRHWESCDIESVVNEIEQRIKTLKCSAVSLSKPALSRMKTLIKTFAGRLPELATTPVMSSQDSEEPSGPQIVICVHPQDAEYGFHMQRMLEETGHSVWVAAPKGEHLVLGDTDVISASQDASYMCMKTVLPEAIMNMSLSVTTEQVAEFQEAVDRASLVIVILTTVFVQSKLCREQLFYCEHRKQILPVVFEDFKVPCWLKMLIRAQRLVSVTQPNFQKAILMQVKRALDPTGKNCLESESQEANINLAVQHLKKTLNAHQCVYVSGASKFHDSTSEAICRSIGKRLAQLENIGLVTGGCFGTSELIAHTFHIEPLRQLKKSSVWHVLPEKDVQDVSSRYTQSSDGTFPLKDFGKTLFCGNSVWEKEVIVGRGFQICLLIEGGLDLVHEVEEFIWSDHIVVPVFSSREDVGDIKLTDKMFQLPPGVSEHDWTTLNDRTKSAEEIGQAVFSVISDLLKRQFHSEDSAAKSVSSESGTKVPEIRDEMTKPASEDATTNVPVGSKHRSSLSSLHSQQTFVQPL